jgi:hypothetical protein
MVCIALASSFAVAADVKVQPAAGSGFAVTDQAGTTERLRVNEAGGVSLPGLATSSTPTSGIDGNGKPYSGWGVESNVVCRDPANGQLTACTVASPNLVRSVKVTKTLSCGGATTCPVSSFAPNDKIDAYCPTYDHYVADSSGALTLTHDKVYMAISGWCTIPGSPSMQATLSVPGTAYDPFFARCTYTGSVGAFSSEFLTTTVLCVYAPVLFP